MKDSPLSKKSNLLERGATEIVVLRLQSSAALLRANALSKSQCVSVEEMEIFFESDKDQSGDGESELYAFHPQRAKTGWLYTPLRRWTAAKISDLCKNDQIQQRARKRERDHGNANPVHVESIQDRGETCAHSQGSYPNQQTETAYRDEERADTLKKCKEETRPAEQSQSFPCAGANRFGDNVVRRDSMNRSGQHGRAYSAKRIQR